MAGTPKTVFVNEYHTIPMAALHRELAVEIDAARTSRPQSSARRLLAGLCGRSGPVSLSWEQLLLTSERLEQEIAEVLSSRHVVFWKHLYRRIFPHVYDEQGSRVGEVTARLVRATCEAAIVKHGNLSSPSGLGNIAEVDIDQVFGGWLTKAVSRFARDAMSARRFLERYKDQHQWGIVDFHESDLVNLYYVEGLCFQYWKLTAQLRAVGKGANLVAFHDGSTCYLPNDKLRRLLASYDIRAAKYSDARTTAVGTWYEDSSSSAERILTLLPNAGELDLGPMFAALGMKIDTRGGSRFFPNFFPALVSAKEYARAHSYIADAFEAAKGFPLSSAVSLLQGLSLLALMRRANAHVEETGEDLARVYNFYSLCQRGYMLMNRQQGEGLLKSLSDDLVSRGSSRVEVEALLSSVTLSDRNRARVSLWSHGPQFPVHLYVDEMVVDFSGTADFLHNLFVGVRDDAHARGMLFESNVRESLVARGIHMEQRNFKFADGSKAEADAVFYKDGRLIVVDCFSMWRPLNFEISSPKTMERRQAMLEDKIDHVLARSDKIVANPVGRNFDFSSASEIVTVVVTPQVEWLWDESSRLWIENDIPRVMQADEFVEWATDEH